MSRDAAVTLELVTKACLSIMSGGKRPSRPLVQALLATPEYIGRKGSNEVVQSLINAFWDNLGKTIKLPERTVDEVPSEYVAVIDKALGELVVIARRMAEETLAKKASELDLRAEEIEASNAKAMEAVHLAEQCRTRAEGELFAMQSQVGELRGQIERSETRLKEESQKVATLQRLVEQKDVEASRLISSLEQSRQELREAGELARAEAKRLLQQIDAERQEARKDAKGLTAQIERLRAELEAAQEALSSVRSEAAASAVARNSLERALAHANAEGDQARANLATAREEVTVLRVRYESADQHRKESDNRAAQQAQELGELRLRVNQLESELSKVRDHPPKKPR